MFHPVQRRQTLIRCRGPSQSFDPKFPVFKLSPIGIPILEKGRWTLFIKLPKGNKGWIHFWKKFSIFVYPINLPPFQGAMGVKPCYGINQF